MAALAKPAYRPIWRRFPLRDREITLDSSQLPDAQYSHAEAVGRLFDCTILSGDALRTPADMWCRLAMGNLLRASAVVRPMRAAVASARSPTQAEVNDPHSAYLGRRLKILAQLYDGTYRCVCCDHGGWGAVSGRAFTFFMPYTAMWRRRSRFTGCTV